MRKLILGFALLTTILFACNQTQQKAITKSEPKQNVENEIERNYVNRSEKPQIVVEEIIEEDVVAEKPMANKDYQTKTEEILTKESSQRLEIIERKRKVSTFGSSTREMSGKRATSSNFHSADLIVSQKRSNKRIKPPYDRYPQPVPPNYNTEDYDAITENEFKSATENPLSTFSIDVDAASYANVRRMINYNKKPQRDAVRIEEMINYFNYDYPQPKNSEPFNVVTELSECPWNENHQLFHIGLQGKNVDTKDLPNSNLVFLLDVSGSMRSQNKLPLLKKSFKLLVEQLRENDRVAIVTYAGSSGLVLPSTSGNNKGKIIESLERLQSGGSTAGAEGIKLAYKVATENFIKGGNNRIILATDGDFNVGVSSDAALTRLIEEEREKGVFISVLGFGMGNYKDNKMQKIANKGNGNHYYIDGIAEAKKVLVQEFGGTLFTIAKDVKLQLEFNPNKVAAYRLIGYENRMLAKEDFNNDKKDAGELGAGHTVTALYEIVPKNVKSKYFASVDELKYQKPIKLDKKYNDELLTVKLRYKKPDEDISKLVTIPVKNFESDFYRTSQAFQFSAAVAQFGLLLRESKFKENANYQNVLNLAKNGRGIDKFGYRKEFIGLVEKVKEM